MQNFAISNGILQKVLDSLNDKKKYHELEVAKADDLINKLISSQQIDLIQINNPVEKNKIEIKDKKPN